MTPGQIHEETAGARPPIEVPGYTLVKVIGRGSYGTVYLARSESGRWRAVKVCRRDGANVRDTDREWRGLQQYEPISRSDPGFLATLDRGEGPDGSWFYSVMELADGIGPGTTAADGGVERELDPEAYEPRTLAYELKSMAASSWRRCCGWA